MILHSLEQAIDQPMNESCSSCESSTESGWNAIITETSVMKAEMVMKFIEQKFAMMQPEIQAGSMAVQFLMKTPNI